MKSCHGRKSAMSIVLAVKFKVFPSRQLYEVKRRVEGLGHEVKRRVEELGHGVKSSNKFMN